MLTVLFDSDNDSNGSEISFDSETTSSEEFLNVVPTLVNETKLEEPCFWDTLLDIGVSCLFCLLCSIFLLPEQIKVFYLQQFYRHLSIFYSSQKEEVDCSTIDVDETNDNNQMDNSTPDNAVEDDPQD